MIKGILLLSIFVSCSYIGILISKKYANRVYDLKEMKNALNIFITKIKFTYEPIPEIFKQIASKVKPNIARIFEISYKNMEEKSAGDAWIFALENSNTNMNKEDIKILKGMSNLLGKVDAEGQISEIELIDTFLDSQIENATQEKVKNEKMYKTLGITFGFAIVVILF